MDSERLKLVEDVYHEAADLAPGELADFLNERCGGDARLRREVESLLSFDSSPNSFIDGSAGSFAAEMFAVPEDQIDLSDREIGHYRIISKIGTGGMGVVYLAQDTKLGRKVAIKFLNKEFSTDESKLRRFIQEAKAASALNHPNILTVFEIGETDETSFIVTEWIDGRTWREHLDETDSQRLKAILDTAIQVAEALAAAHNAGITHRDIKPENIMVRKDGYAKILDFGLAKLAEDPGFIGSIGSEDKTRTAVKTRSGIIMGTVSYMSPEQARGKKTDTRTDLWSLGVVIYEMLTAQLPFRGETMSDTVASILTETPLPLDHLIANAPDGLQEILDRTLAKRAEDRYQSAEELRFDLMSLRRALERSGDIERPTTLREGTSLSGNADRRKTGTDRAFTNEERQETLSIEIEKIRTRYRTAAIAAIAIVLVTGLGYLGYLYFSGASEIRSIAVMPFANETGSVYNDYVSDGLSDSTINKLSQLPHLKVISRTSTFRFKGKELDVDEVARSLGVEAIITGQITQQADTLQINVEMIRAADKTRLWGEIYTRKVSDEINVPEAITQAVAHRLEIKLSPDQERQIVKQITSNTKAYQLHMNGLFFRRKNGVDNIRKAIEYQEQAIKIDPSFTRAYIELSINYANLVDIRAMSPAEGVPKARAAAERALALDETLADAHYNIARIRKYEFEWIKAEAAFKRSIELNANIAAAHTIYAEFLSQLGRFDEALREIRLAQELDPLRTGLVGNEGSIYYLARQYDEAVVKKQIHVSAAPENPFAHLGLGIALAANGQFAEAIDAYQTSVKLDETPSALIYLGRAFTLTGRRDEALAILYKLNATEKYVSPAELAILYAALGDNDGAFNLLDKAYKERDVQMTSLKVDPCYDPIRADPRFAQMLNRLNLPE